MGICTAWAKSSSCRSVGCALPASHSANFGKWRAKASSSSPARSRAQDNRPGFMAMYCLLLIRPQPLNLPPLSAFVQQRNQVFHQRQFFLPPDFPTQLQRGQQVSQLFPIENHAAQNAFHKGLQGSAVQSVLLGNPDQFSRTLFCLEALETVANVFFTQSLAHLQGVDIGNDVITLVDELGIGLDQTNQLGAGHFALI